MPAERAMNERRSMRAFYQDRRIIPPCGSGEGGRASGGPTPDILPHGMDRRQFLAAGAAGLGLSALSYGDQKTLRVGLIGCGWYGKSDLFPADSGVAGGGGVAMRCRPQHALGGGGHGGHAAEIEEAAADL